MLMTEGKYKKEGLHAAIKEENLLKVAVLL